MDAKRDWGHAKDYVEMQWLMLQQEIPEDFTISTGEQYSVREFVEIVETLLGDSTKARDKLGWVPKITFKELVKEMVVADLKDAKRDHLCRTKGYSTYNYNE